jgi:DNA-binding NtrC family response regulator
MHKKRIMVIEADDERLKQLNFLLRLTCYESRTLTDISEAVNWARLCQQSGEEALCLLINSVRSSEDCAGILEFLSRHAFTLPVILVRRDKWDGAVPTARFPTLRILSCLPATLNAALSAIDHCLPRLRSSATRQVMA